MATQNEIEALKKEIETLSQTVKQLQREKTEEIKKSIEEYIPQDLASEVKELKEKMEDKLPAIKEEGGQILENISKFTKKNPLISLGIAVGIGVLIGKALKK